MSAHQSTQWFWSDWAGDQEVRRLTPAERGLWIDLLALAAVGIPAGYVCDQRGKPLSYEEIGRFTNASPTEVASLIVGILEKGVASRDRAGRLFNRRMVRHAQKRAEKAAAGKLGGDQTRKRWLELSSNTLKLSDISSGARAYAVAPARAPPTRPYQSSSIKTATVSEDTAKGLGNGMGKTVAELTRADLDAIYSKKGLAQ